MAENYSLKKVRRVLSTIKHNPGRVFTPWKPRKISDPRPINYAAQSFEAVIKQVQEGHFERVCVLGDAPFNSSVARAGLKSECEWLSNNANDILGGAKPLSEVTFSASTAVLVGGEKVRATYIQLMGRLAHCAILPRVFWVGSGFEFCLSSIAIPAEADDAHVYLFNHFSTFFGVKEPLLVKMTLSDSKQSIEQYLMLPPDHTKRFVISELFRKREGTTYVGFNCTHPTLTMGRHYRWRSCTDMFWENSFTTIHSGHDNGPAGQCQSRISRSLVPNSRLIITVPNYNRDLKPEEQIIRIGNGEEAKQIARSNNEPAIQIEFPPSEKGGFYTYQYRGYGTSFCYFLRNKKEKQMATIAGNHESTIEVIEQLFPLRDELGAKLNKLSGLNLVFHPHSLPITAETDDLEFGFSFAAANPQVTKFLAHIFDKKGALLGMQAFSLSQSGMVYSPQLVKILGKKRKGSLVIVSPDWKGQGCDPTSMNMVGELAVRCRKSGDFDVTEFQNSWRNLGMAVAEFPHWLHPDTSFNGRTKTMGRSVTQGGLSDGILVVNASGNLGYKETAEYTITLYNRAGEVQSRRFEILPFTHQLVWLPKVFTGIEKFLIDGYGTYVVTSGTADLNCQGISRSKKGAVSIQHLWGY